VSTRNELSAALELHQAGQLEAAAKIYSRLFESDRNNADAGYGLGTVLMQQKQFAPAAQLLGHALSLEPNVPEFRHNYALALKGLAQDLGRKRDFPAAIRTYEMYLQLKNPESSDLLAYADLLLLARKPDAAKQAIERAMQAGSDLSAAHLIAARCARLEGNYDMAREHLRTAIEKRPAFGDAWQLLLEIEPQVSLSGLVAKCAGLAADTDIKPRDRALLAMTAGRAFEKLKDFAQAFEHFSLGNELQRQGQADRNVRYSHSETEGLATRAKAVFGAAIETANEIDTATQPIFIVGMPRSGTTLVERILGGMEGVVMGGESESMGVIATQYYWNLEQGNDNDFTELAADYWRRELCDPCRRTDKMPHNFWHVGLIAEIFPAAPIIYMRRDPRDVCMSIFSRVFSDGHPYATDLQSLAHFHNVSADLMRHWMETLPSRIIDVSYEELIENPEQETQSIAIHCGLDWVPECLDFHERVGTSFTYSEMQVREPLNSKGVGAWRRYADRLDALLIALDDYGLLPES